MKKYLLALIIFLLAASRFAYAAKIPAGMSNDEIEYAASAKSYALSGKDISGYGLPVSLLKTQTDGDISPVPALILSIPFKIIPMTQGNLRIIYILLNLFTTIPIYFIAEHLFPKRKIGILSAVLFLINPWSIYFSRVIVDTPFALFFYLWAIALLLKYKGWKLAIPFVLFIFAFFSYHGGKFIFLPVILFTVIYKSYTEKIKLLKSKSLMLFLVAAFITAFAFLIISQKIPNSSVSTRSGELFFNNMDQITSVVNGKRRQSIDNPLTKIFVNKFTETVKIFINKYLVAFSPDVLFTKGDIRATYRFEDHGLFYLLDIPLLLIGFAAIFSKSKSKSWYLLGLIISAPIATAINTIESSVINRSFFLLPLFIIISAYGFTELTSLSSNQKVKIIITTSLSFILALSFANFYSFYLFRFPVTAQENYWLSESVLYKYVGYAPKDKQIEVITTRQRSSYLRYVLLNPVLQQKYIYPDLPYITNDLTVPYKVENITFSGICPKTLDKNTIYAIATNTNCNIDQKPNFLITDQKDAGGLTRIFNSDVCKDVSTENWRRLNSMSYYNLQSLSYEDFCRNWIFKP